MFKDKFFKILFILILLVPLAVSGCSDDDDDEENEKLRSQLSAADIKAAEDKAKRIQEGADAATDHAAAHELSGTIHDTGHDPTHDAFHAAIIAAQPGLNSAQKLSVAAGLSADAFVASVSADNKVVAAEADLAAASPANRLAAHLALDEAVATARRRQDEFYVARGILRAIQQEIKDATATP